MSISSIYALVGCYFGVEWFCGSNFVRGCGSIYVMLLYNLSRGFDKIVKIFKKKKTFSNGSQKRL